MLINYLEELGIELDQIEEYLKSYSNFIIESIDINNLKLIVSYLLSNNFDLYFVKSLLLENLEIFTYNFFYIKKNIDRIKLLNKNYIEIIKNNPEKMYNDWGVIW